MKKINLIPVFLLLTLFSCQPIMMKIYGVKDPDIENEKSITKKALKYGLDTSNIVTVNSKDFLYEINGRSIPNGAIYDKNGKYIEYRQSDTTCNASLTAFIPLLNVAEKYNQPDSSDLSNKLNKFRDLKGNRLPAREEADFYLLIYWTVWTGKLNKDKVKVWEDLAHENKDSKIKVIKVNMDIQEYWEEEELDKILKIMSNKK
jgi:hypothetical protein